MPTLLDLQRAVYRGLVAGEDGPCAAHVVADGIVGAARLNVYRNTFIGNLTTALRLVYPAIRRLVGAPFFESAVRLFIEAEPPRSASPVLRRRPRCLTCRGLHGSKGRSMRRFTPLTPLRSTCRVSPRSTPRITAISRSCRILRSVSSRRIIR